MSMSERNMFPPKHVLSFAAQAFADQVFHLGESQLVSAIDKNPQSNLHGFTDSERLSRGLMACEIVAASRGNACHAPYWSYFAQKWLYESKYEAQPGVVEKALNWLDKYVGDETCYVDLRGRLASDLRKETRCAPDLNVKTAVKLSRSFPELILQNNELIGLHPDCSESIAMSYFRQIATLRLGVSTKTLPEHIESLKIMLLGCKDTLTHFEFDVVGGIDPSRPLDSCRLLKGCEGLLSHLAKLTTVQFTNLFVDDSIVEAVSRNESLESFRISIECRNVSELDQIQISQRSITSLLGCPRLRVFDSPSTSLRGLDVKELRKKMASNWIEHNKSKYQKR